MRLGCLIKGHLWVFDGKMGAKHRHCIRCRKCQVGIRNPTIWLTVTTAKYDEMLADAKELQRICAPLLEGLWE